MFHYFLFNNLPPEPCVQPVPSPPAHLGGGEPVLEKFEVKKCGEPLELGRSHLRGQSIMWGSPFGLTLELIHWQVAWS